MGFSESGGREEGAKSSCRLLHGRGKGRAGLQTEDSAAGKCCSAVAKGCTQKIGSHMADLGSSLSPGGLKNMLGWVQQLA